MPFNKLVKSLRQFRSLHQWIGISVALFLLITSVTGIFLGWKKNVQLLQPATIKGTSIDVKEWITFDEVIISATNALANVEGEHVLERLDVRPDKGIIKVIYLDYWEVQVDGKTGNVLSVAKRHSDWIEHLHDGSLISDGFKLVYTNYIGLGLLFLSVTGFWLWYGPRRIRKLKQH